MKLRSTSGVSLLEVLIAVVMVTISVVMMSLLFPKTSKSIVVNRQRLAATTLAASRIEDIKRLPYLYVDTTTASTAYFSSIVDPGCDCAAVTNFAALPNAEVIPSTGTTYNRYTCINFVTFNVGGSSQAYCQTDTGYKYIKVRVAWKSGTDTFFIDQDSSVTRY
jgi:type II secretory pathway pseudopilin PulG